MQRSLYRVYLYGIIIILLYFTATATALFLAVLLEETPLNGTQSAQVTGSEVVQPAVFAIISWIITISVGGLHYWLLRRNEISDASAANSSVRALFVNLGEGLAAVIALTSGIIGINEVLPESGAAAAFATFLVFGALFLLFELERRRMPARAGAALVLQRLHLSGLQLIFLVFFLLPALWNAVSSSFYTILANTGAIAVCNEHLYSLSYTFCYSSLNGSSILTLWLIVGLVVLAWLCYWLLARGDRSGNLVKTIHFLSLATGVIVTLVAMERALELLARILLGVGANGSDLAQSYDFVTPLIVGLLFLGASIVLLRGDRPVAPDRSGTTLPTALALTAALMALPFWVGCAILLDNVVEHFVPEGSSISMTIPLALVFTGVGYIPLELWLRARRRGAGAVPVPQRALEFALLAVGMLGSVMSLIVLLFAILTATLGNPLDQWQMLARVAASGLLVSVLLLLVYGRQVLAERGLRAEQKVSVAEPTATATTIEQILDELLAGRMTRDQAAEQIRALV